MEKPLQIDYRQLMAGDAPAVSALRLAVIVTDPAAFTITLEQERRASTAVLANVLDHYKHSEDRLVTGAFTPDLVGMIGAEYVDSGECAGAVRLWGMNVLASHRRRGIATALLARATKFAGELGSADRVMLQVATAASDARRLYQNVGFTEIANNSDSVAGSLVMELPLR